MIKNYTNQIWQLVSLTREDFKRIYLTTIDNFLTIETCQPASDQSLQRAILALKIRRAYMLPVGANAETCYQEQEVWTYAVFVSGLMGHRRAELLKTLPENIRAWIERYPSVKKAFESFESEAVNSGNVLSEMVALAQEHLTLIETTEKSLAGSPALMDVLFNWLNTGIKNKTIPVNDREGWVHVVDNGTLLVLPACYEQFIKDNAAVASKIFKDQLNEKEFIKKLVQGDYLIEGLHGYKHDYFFGDWSQRIRLSGLLLSSNPFLEALANTKINSQLQLDILG